MSSISSVLVIIFLSFSNAQIDDGANIMKCPLDESLGVFGCVLPVLGLFNDANIANMTRSRSLRIIAQCQNAVTCLSDFECAQTHRIDKLFGTLCDSIKFFTHDFVPCEKLLAKPTPPCFKDFNPADFFSVPFRSGEFCKRSKKIWKCAKEEIPNVCGENYWIEVDKIFHAMMRYGFPKCRLVDNSVARNVVVDEE